MEAGLLIAADRANLVTSIKQNTTPATSNSSNTQSDSNVSPSVRVDLSDTGRQLSVEAQQRSTVQETSDTATLASSTERNTNTERVTLSAGEQNTTLSATEETEQELNSPELNTVAGNPTRNTETEESLVSSLNDTNTANNTQSAEAAPQQPVRTNQNASLVTQYNVTPDSIIGQSISIQA